MQEYGRVFLVYRIESPTTSAAYKDLSLCVWK